VLADLDQGAVMSLPVDGYVATQAWRVARAMGQVGLLGRDGATEAGQRTLVEAMTSPAS
jgi:hypothetical protein